MSRIEELVSGHKRIPTLEETASRVTGPWLSRIRMRTITIYAVLSASALALTVAYYLGAGIPPKLVAVLLGILVPGGGFVATGHIWHMLVGIILCFLFFKFGFFTMDKAGDVSVGLSIWLIGMLGGLDSHNGMQLPFYGPLAVVLLACATWGYWSWRSTRVANSIKASRARREVSLPPAIERIEKIYTTPDPEPQEGRELTEAAVDAARYIYDIALADDPIALMDKLKFNSVSAYRYQISYLSYALLQMQCKYTPSFAGYQKEALKKLIEAYLRPETTSYWKWESLGGYLRWSPDPVKYANVMLTGWMAPAMVGYSANFGDDTFLKEGSLPFKPSLHKDTVYSYSVPGIIDLLKKQFAAEPLHFISCEPNMMFPVCNAYAIAGMMMYDRAHNTGHTEEVYDLLDQTVKHEFMEMSGDMAVLRNQLTGLRFTPDTNMDNGFLGNIAIAQPFSPMFPGIGRRAYALIRDEGLRIDDDGLAYFGPVKWEDMVDMGTMQKNPGSLLSMLLLSALEYGDYEMEAALRRTMDKHLTLSKRRFKYNGVSVCAMASLAATHWVRKDDWYDTIVKGPGEAALTGPLLTGVNYPDVLVAKAVSDGQDLSLVLYSGSGSAEQDLTIERLKPYGRYRITEDSRIVESDGNGTATVRVSINGRTELHVVPAGGDDR